MTTIISKATATDIPLIAELEQQYYQQEGYPAGFLYQALRQWPEGLWVARDNAVEDNQVIGYALMAPAPNQAGIDIEPWLMALLVSAAGRGKGIGRKLCEALIQHCQTLGKRGLWLSVAEDNHAAIQLYLNLGFQHVERRNDFLGPGEHRLLMRLTLDQ